MTITYQNNNIIFDKAVLSNRPGHMSTLHYFEQTFVLKIRHLDRYQHKEEGQNDKSDPDDKI